MNPTLSGKLLLNRCPHCSVASPNLHRVHHLQTQNHAGINLRAWGIYSCGTCGGLVTAWSMTHGAPIMQHFPKSDQIDIDVPERPRAYLQQAQESLHAPAGAVMLAASAVDSMLKLKGYTEGTLYKRIEKAAADLTITPEMAKWAHAVRLDANEQRHADEAATLPCELDAKRVIEFAKALAEFMFVLPIRIERGINADAG